MGARFYQSLKVMVGGEAKLRQAVQRGAVKMENRNGVEMFVFPNTSSVVKEMMEQEFETKVDMPSCQEPYHDMPKRSQPQEQSCCTLEPPPKKKQCNDTWGPTLKDSKLRAWKNISKCCLTKINSATNTPCFSPMTLTTGDPWLCQEPGCQHAEFSWTSSRFNIIASLFLYIFSIAGCRQWWCLLCIGRWGRWELTYRGANLENHYFLGTES